MKTLDEVIKDMENCVYQDSDCSQCPALHYLRLFQKHEERVRGQLDDLKQEYRPNEPLDWETLKTMEGKPVWVELTFPEGAYSHWGIIWGFPKAGYEFMELWGFHEIQSFSVMQKEQGKTWQAYRKERHER